MKILLQVQIMNKIVHWKITKYQLQQSFVTVTTKTGLDFLVCLGPERNGIGSIDSFFVCKSKDGDDGFWKIRIKLSKIVTFYSENNSYFTLYLLAVEI
jgi:hypothetical protein